MEKKKTENDSSQPTESPVGLRKKGIDYPSPKQRKIYKTGAENINKAILWANRSDDLGCRIRRNKNRHFGFEERLFNEHFHESTNIEGTSKDGKSIYIEFWPPESNKKKIPKLRQEFMLEMEGLGAIVGMAFDYFDVYDIIKCGKRKKRTFYYREKQDGKTKESIERDGSTEDVDSND